MRCDPPHPVHNGGVRNLAPWALLVLLAFGAATGAAVGIADAQPHHAVPAVDGSGTDQSQFVGMTLRQAEQLAQSEGVHVRLWRLPTDAPVGTVLQEISSRPGSWWSPPVLRRTAGLRCSPPRARPCGPCALRGSDSTPTATPDRPRVLAVQ